MCDIYTVYLGGLRGVDGFLGLGIYIIVCGSAHDSVRVVRAIVCISALGSVWQCARQWAALSGSAAECGSVRQCGSAAVRQYVVYNDRRSAMLWWVAQDVYLCCL
jgi:hypothetical protein